MTNQRCCGNCFHFYQGECRRFPPQVWGDPQTGFSDAYSCSFPQVIKHEWCGEFKMNDSKYPNIPDYLLN